jgi:copper chaperone CopZ
MDATAATNDETPTIRYCITGMDCRNCAARIESAARAVTGVKNVKVSIASQMMALQVGNTNASIPIVERAVTDLGYRLTRIDDATTGDNDFRP